MYDVRIRVWYAMMRASVGCTVGIIMVRHITTCPCDSHEESEHGGLVGDGKVVGWERERGGGRCGIRMMLCVCVGVRCCLWCCVL